jgi:AraC family transcriptional activator of pobA
MESRTDLKLINRQSGELAMRILTLDGLNNFDHIQRNNYYSLIWLSEGSGKAIVDFASYEVFSNTLFAFSPYQPFMFSMKNLKGTAIYFHPDFFCIHRHQTETPCLFNDIYQLPYTILDERSMMSLQGLIDQMKKELESSASDQYEVLVSYLKIFLITTSRRKIDQRPQITTSGLDRKEPFILQTLKDTIEKDFKTKHSPKDYAETLNISTKALSKIIKGHFHRTFTELISERIIIEAKRELYLTSKPIKEIAIDLGYDDVYYFSRFFKSNVDISPQVYRKTVGFGKGESQERVR